MEIPNSYLVATNATTTLTKALAPTDTTITVADTHALPVTTTLVEIHSASNASLREKITIAIDPVT
ncbi:hypothetical protein, partial [Streptomyces niveiscabiei]|uniref:hypothetical protein n=1 Tax=Streptomyces niveiscabiei TaxID=164115 RepID=UPI0038F7DB18